MTRSLSYRLHFHELGIAPDHLADALAQGHTPLPEPFNEMIGSLLQSAPTLCRIQGGVMIYEGIRLDAHSHRVYIEGVEFNPQERVFGHLARSERIALFTCTAGQGIGQHSSNLMQHGDPVGGYIADTLGTLAVERAMDRIQERFARAMRREGLATTNRLSPGYCGWDVAEQQKLFQLLPRPFGGVTLSPRSLMSPIKSVSGMIGIGRGVRHEAYACEGCDRPTCNLSR